MIAKYDAWICGQPELMAALHQLRGGDLACWCAPEAYDGDEAAGACQLGCCVERTHGDLRHRGATIQREVAHRVAGVGTFRLLHNFASVAGVTLALMYTSGRSAAHHLWLVGDERPGSR